MDTINKNNEVTTLNELVTLDSLKFKDLSDKTMKRMRIIFPNGLGISIVQGEFSYGGKNGLYEIAPLNKDNALDGSILGMDDDVEGFLTEEEVLKRCYLIKNLDSL